MDRAPAVPALLLVDVIQAFFSPQGSMHYPEAERVLPALRRLLQAARDADRLVVHAVERHRPGLADFEYGHIGEHCVVGAADAAIHPGFELDEDAPKEVLLAKRRYSAFFGTDLDLLLREEGVTTVVVGGVKTNVCIRASVQDAFALGYRVVVPREATNSNRPHLAAASLEDIERYFGEVTSIDQAEALL